MSQSTSAPEATKPLTLRVSTGSADAEIFVIDHELRLVDRGIGSLVTQQLPGVYKVKVQARRNVQEKTILLVEDASIEWQAQPIDSAAPIRGAARTHEYQMAGAADRSRRVDLRRGTGGSLFVMLRNWSARGGATVVPGRGHPGARFRLAAWDRSWDLDLASLAVEDSALDPWCAVNIEVDPGTYLIQCRAGEGSMLEGAVFVSPGWQTQVFLLSRAPASDAAGFAVDLAETGEVLNATVSMSRNGFAPDDVQLQATETARLALADDRPVRTRELDELLRYKLENPMLGIMGAHLLLLARQERVQRQAEGQRRERLRDESATLTRQQPPFDQELFDTVIDNLRRLVGPSHPDVQALSLQRSGATDPGAITVPPMLRRSWSLLVEGSNRWPGLVPVDLWRRIAMRTATAPFLSWMTSSSDASGTSAFLGELREQLTSKPRTVARAVRAAAPAARSMSPAPEPGDSEQIAADFDIEAPEPADPGHIATEFDIPRAAVEWLVKK